LSRFRTPFIGCAVGALAITASGMSAAAADPQGTLALVNGIPGKRVDVCINGNETRSGVRYGQAVLRDVIPTGNKNVKFYARDPRTCRGNVLAQTSFVLDPGEDLTIVATRKAPKVVTFDNAGLGEIPPAGAPFANSSFAWRHASEVAANFRYRYWQPDPESPVGPAADPVWTKGGEVSSPTTPGTILQLRATRAGELDTIAVKRAEMGTSRRYEWILVGTSPANTRFVFIDRAISHPSP
jgi:hypothetical protein